MNTSLPPEHEEAMEPVGYDFGLKRRSFVQLLGAGLLLAVSVAPPWPNSAEAAAVAGALATSRRASTWEKTVPSPS